MAAAGAAGQPSQPRWTSTGDMPPRRSAVYVQARGTVHLTRCCDPSSRRHSVTIGDRKLQLWQPPLELARSVRTDGRPGARRSTAYTRPPGGRARRGMTNGPPTSTYRAGRQRAIQRHGKRFKSYICGDICFPGLGAGQPSPCWKLQTSAEML